MEVNSVLYIEVKHRYRLKVALTTSLAFLAIAACTSCSRPAPYGPTSRAAPYGLTSRPAASPYLRMPLRGDGDIPLLLSQTGAFRDTARLTPGDALIPYDLIVPFWSDGADKQRFVAVPGKIVFSPTGEWVFPPGTVFVKPFELPTDAANPNIKRRLETRLLVRDAGGGVFGVVYKWRADGGDADLLLGEQTENIAVKTATGEVRQQTWY